jgi:hypothetical protein
MDDREKKGKITWQGYLIIGFVGLGIVYAIVYFIIFDTGVHGEKRYTIGTVLGRRTMVRGIFR